MPQGFRTADKSFIKDRGLIRALEDGKNLNGQKVHVYVGVGSHSGQVEVTGKGSEAGRTRNVVGGRKEIDGSGIDCGGRRSWT